MMSKTDFTTLKWNDGYKSIHWQYIEIDNKKFDLNDILECIYEIQKTGNDFWDNEWSRWLVKEEVLKEESKDVLFSHEKSTFLVPGPRFEEFVKNFVDECRKRYAHYEEDWEEG